MNKFSTRLTKLTFIFLLLPGIAIANLDPYPYNSPFDFFADSGWNQFSNDDGISESRGGQAYDAEYLYYKYDNQNERLSIGLQSGFNLNTGRVNDYYTGDLALSFDADNSNYEYAIDFGLTSKNKYLQPINDGTNSTGVDAAGLYKVVSWNNDILYNDSAPWAMDEGELKQAIYWDNSAAWGDNWYSDKSDIDTNGWDNAYGRGFSDGNNNTYTTDGSYFRVVTFDLSYIENLSQNFTVDAHWTMSCGNDEINGDFDINRPGNVPEPSVLSLVLIGGISVGFLANRKRRKK
jgi:hypothetical protein